MLRLLQPVACREATAGFEVGPPDESHRPLGSERAVVVAQAVRAASAVEELVEQRPLLGVDQRPDLGRVRQFRAVRPVLAHVSRSDQRADRGRELARRQTLDVVRAHDSPAEPAEVVVERRRRRWHRLDLIERADRQRVDTCRAQRVGDPPPALRAFGRCRRRALEQLHDLGRIEAPRVRMGEQVTDRPGVAAMQLVMSDPAGHVVTVDVGDVVGEPEVVEAGEVDRLERSVLGDPLLPLGLPVVDGVEVVPLGERLARQLLAAAERRMQPRRQPEHRLGRCRTGLVATDQRDQPAVHPAVNERHAEAQQRRPVLLENRAVGGLHRLRRDAAEQQRRRRRAVRAVVLPRPGPRHFECGGWGLGRLRAEHGAVGVGRARRCGCRRHGVLLSAAPTSLSTRRWTSRVAIAAASAGV